MLTRVHGKCEVLHVESAMVSKSTRRGQFTDKSVLYYVEHYILPIEGDFGNMRSYLHSRQRKPDLVKRYLLAPSVRYAMA